ncbi:hypothetical protein KUTeg_012784 [Tegillarca granosa]|uniref:Potassium channel tetramerisation-type BTB domain-containing protein n=1 Tax=Tegillarca granosa TaxID=220873 RepID=A0ABQ9F0Q9_TEGGR|nr:hypothetical protein KUTeg_012784 [Tegillarca granosa]
MKTKKLFYQRSATSFEAILNFYQTGKLHIPNQVCPKSFKLELDFWQVGMDNLDQCCLHKYLIFRSNADIMDTFHAHDNKDDEDNNVENTS